MSSYRRRSPPESSRRHSPPGRAFSPRRVSPPRRRSPARRYSRSPSSSDRSIRRGERPHRDGGGNQRRRFHRFDSPPKESTIVANLHGLSDQPVDSLRRMHQLTSAATAAAQGALAEQQRQARELYIGNIPPGITIYALIDKLNELLIRMGATTMPGKPIVSGWLGSEGQFAFIEFRTAEECSNALSLNGYPIEDKGQTVQIKVGRPRGAVSGSVGVLTNGTSSSIYQVTPFSLDDTPGIAGFAVGMAALQAVVSLEESTQIEKLVLVGAPRNTPQSDIEPIVKEFGDIEQCDTFDSSLGTCLLFHFKDVDCQRRCIHQAKNFSFPSHSHLKDPSPLAVIRQLDAIILGYLDLPNNQFDKGEKGIIRPAPSRIVWMTGFPSVAPELELQTELTSECAKFGALRRVQLLRLSASAVVVDPVVSTAASEVLVAVVEFEHVSSAVKCVKYFRTEFKCFYFPEDKYVENDLSLFQSHNMEVHVTKSAPLEELILVPKISKGRVISVEKELQSDFKQRTKPAKPAPEDLEVID